MLGLRRELADRHVFDHAPPQRAYGLIGHEGCSCLDGGCEPLISRQDAPSRYPIGRIARSSALPRERFSPLALNRRQPLGQRPLCAAGSTGHGNTLIFFKIWSVGHEKPTSHVLLVLPD